MTLEEQINLYNQVHDDKFYIIRQSHSYPDLLLHPDIKNSIAIDKNINLETISRLRDIYQNLSRKNQIQTKINSENIIIEKDHADSKTVTELTPASDNYVTIAHTRYQTLHQVTLKLNNGIIMTCDSLKPITIKLHGEKQCQKKDVSDALTQLEKETQLQADDIHYGAY